MGVLMAIRTSKPYNDTFELIEGFYWPALAVGLLVFVGVLVLLILSGLDTLYVVAAASGSGWFAGKTAQNLMGGDYFMHGWEKFLAAKQELMLLNVVNLAEELKLRESDSKGYLVTDTGTKVYGFEILADQMEPKDFESDMHKIIGDVEYPHRFQYYRDSVAMKIEGVEASVNQIRTILLLEIDPLFKDGGNLPERISKTLAKSARTMSNGEIFEFLRMIHGKGVPKDSLIPHEEGFLSQIRLLRKEAVIHGGGLGEGMMAISLSKIPESISDDFRLLLDTINARAATVCVSVRPIQKMSALGKLFEKRMLEKLSKKGGVEVSAADRCEVRMSLTAIVHGTKDELNTFETLLRREISGLEVGEGDLEFAVDSACMKECLLSLFPGHASDLPMRRQYRIRNKKELVKYMPLPVSSGKAGSLMEFRTLMNMLYRFELSPKDPLFIYAPMGRGKTVLISDFLLTFLEKIKDPHYFLLTAGDGYHFLLDGLCDFPMVFRTDRDGRYEPLWFQPLEAFFSLGEIALEAASHWVCDILGVINKDDGKPDSDYNSGIMQILSKMRASGKVRMSDFYQEFCEWIALQWPIDRIPLDHHARFTPSRLKDFCGVEGSQFGYLFEPKEAKPVDMMTVRRFYVTQEKAVNSKSRALQVYFNLSRCLFDKWSDVAVDKKSTFVGIDELNHLLEVEAFTEQQLDTFGSQGRKQGFYTVVGTQRLKDIDGLSKDFIRAFQHFLFAGPADQEQVAKMFDVSSDEGKQRIFERFEDLNQKIRYVRRREELFAWGYVTREKDAEIIVHDVSKRKLWTFASEMEARLLKQETMETFGRPLTETARLLALYGPSRPPRGPSEQLTAKEKEYVYDRIIKHRYEATESFTVGGS